MDEIDTIFLDENSKCHIKAHEIKTKEMQGQAWHAGAVGLL